jgi:hypothetical protein
MDSSEVLSTPLPLRAISPEGELVLYTESGPLQGVVIRLRAENGGKKFRGKNH